MFTFNFLPPALLILWAGLALGGNLIAAPAKFGATSVPVADLLQVGKLQFRWLANTEWVLLGLTLAAGVFTSRPHLLWLALPVGLFLVQRFAVFPELDARTIRTIAGETVPHSNIHLVYIGFELAKLATLIGVAGWIVRHS